MAFTKKAHKPTPAQVAMYGHSAATLRDYLAKHNMTPREFNVRMGKEPGHTGVYSWIAAKGAPSPNTALQISQVLGIPAQNIVRKGMVVEASSALVRVNGAGGGGGAVAGGGEVLPPVPKPTRVLSFSLDSTGTVHIDLSVSLPVEHGLQVLRALEGAGLMRTSEP